MKVTISSKPRAWWAAIASHRLTMAKDCELLTLRQQSQTLIREIDTELNYRREARFDPQPLPFP